MDPFTAFETLLKLARGGLAKAESHRTARWKKADLERVYSTVMRAHSGLRRGFVSYPHGIADNTTVPFYVDPQWPPITASSLHLAFTPDRPVFTPSRSQRRFWDFYRKLRTMEDYDLDVFRLLRFEASASDLTLEFGIGKFSHSVMSQYILEDEILLAERDPLAYATMRHRRPLKSCHRILPAEFLRKNVVRVGVCNLILLRVDEDRYWPIVHRRATESMIDQDLFDPVSSCVFEVVTTAKADFDLFHTVLREIYEELLGGTEVSRRSRVVDPCFFYGADGIVDLLNLRQKGDVQFHITGFGVDLVRMLPEITTVLCVEDPQYFHDHMSSSSGRTRFLLNLEFTPVSPISVPRSLHDVENYLASEVTTDPDRSDGKTGFAPHGWTLAGGYCFMQALRWLAARK